MELCKNIYALYGSLFYNVLIGLTAVVALFDFVRHLIYQSWTLNDVIRDSLLLSAALFYIISIRWTQGLPRYVLMWMVILLHIGGAIFVHSMYL